MHQENNSLYIIISSYYATSDRWLRILIRYVLCIEATNC